MTTSSIQCEKAAQAAAKWWGDRLQRGDREIFEKVLQEKIAYQLVKRGQAYVECDYDPQGILLEAVHAAGVSCEGRLFSARGILPQKHSLRITLTELFPKEGYANWTEVIDVKEGPI